MDRIRSAAGSPFGAAVLGGLVVGLLGWVAIAAGWIEADSEREGPLAVTPLTEPASGGEDGQTVNEIYSEAAPGVGFVRAETQAEPPAPFSPFGRPPRGGTATGSAFVIDEDGHMLTNAHVVDGADRVEVTLGEDTETLEAEVLGRDPSTDLALLEVGSLPEDVEPLPLGSSDDVEVGDPAIAIGNPFGLDSTATAGIVSALQREIPAPNGFTISEVIQTDAPINPGNSGGPLLDAAGRVIGINSQIESPAGGNVGIGFAVSIDTARDVAEQLLEDGEVSHAFLGITGADVTPQIADVLNLSTEDGALVQEVVPGGPSDDAGIEGGSAEVSIGVQRIRAGGDVITEVDGREISSMDDVIAAVNAKRPGDGVELTLSRKGEERTVTVELGDRPARTTG